MQPHGGQPVVAAGAPLGEAPVVVILVHGRNAGPSNILDLLPRLERPDLTFLAPTAANRTWYPFGFMTEIEKNEPDLSSALLALETLVAKVEAAGVPRSRIVMLGFSQGACLTSEFAVRHASRFGGLIILTGGAIGPPGTQWNYPGSFDGTPVFLGSGDPDSHVPVSRVSETAELFTRMGASVTKRIYPGRSHSISDDEIAMAKEMIAGVETPAISELTSHSQHCRVVFGAGSRSRITNELDAMGLKRVLIVTTPGRSAVAEELQASMQQRCVGICARAEQHVPVASITAALADVDRLKPDAVLAIGGGSAIGLAKAIALNRTLSVLVMPTTYAGSEMTSIYGITDGAEKRTGRDPRVAPRLVIYDPELTTSLPAAESAASGMNAIAHAVEALYAANVSPLATASAVEAIRLLGRALPLVAANPADLNARALALRGAHAAGIALELATMGLHHKICHVLGGTFGLPHAKTHAAILPYVVEFNTPAAPEAMKQIAAALGVSDAAQGLRALNEKLGLHDTLATLGLRVTDIPRAAALIAASNYPNPRPVSEVDVRSILSAAL